MWELPPQHASLDADLKPVEITIEVPPGPRHYVLHRLHADGTTTTTSWDDESPAVADEDDEEVTPTIPGPATAPEPVITGHPKMIPNKLKIQPKCYVCGRGSPTSLRREDGTVITCCPICIQLLGYEPIDETSFDLRLKPPT